MKAKDIAGLLVDHEGNDLMEALDEWGDTPDILEYLVLEIEALEAEVAAARELLAVIHGDGGHHHQKHGLESYKAAETKFYEARNTKKLCEYPCSCC